MVHMCQKALVLVPEPKPYLEISHCKIIMLDTRNSFAVSRQA